MAQPDPRYTETHDYSDPRASRPYFDVQAAIILALVVVIVIAIARFNATASVTGTITTAPVVPISTPALPTAAPIYYAPPVPTLIPVQPQTINNDNRICVFVVDCGK